MNTSPTSDQTSSEPVKNPEQEELKVQEIQQPQVIHPREIKKPLYTQIESSENSGDEKQITQIDEDQFKKKEEQSLKIIEMLRREVETKERNKQRKEAVNALFKDEEERKDHGVTDKTVRYMVKKIKEYVKELRIRNRQLTKEDDFVKVDDTWLNMSKMMLEPFRLNFQNIRLEQFKTMDPAAYLENVLAQIQKKRDLTVKAGEMICTFLELDFVPFIYQRTPEEPTIVEYIDPIQFMIPTPKTSKVIDVMEKDLCRDLLKHIITVSSKKIKDNQEVVKIKRNQLQPLYHFLIEDMLWLDYDIDLEDFKQTVMFH